MVSTFLEIAKPTPPEAFTIPEQKTTLVANSAKSGVSDISHTNVLRKACAKMISRLGPGIGLTVNRIDQQAPVSEERAIAACNQDRNSINIVVKNFRLGY